SPLHAVPGRTDERREETRRRHALRWRAQACDDPPDGDGVSLMDIVIRAIVIFVFLYVLMRVIGRRELSTLEPFDVILLVVLGDLVQQGVTQNDFSVTGVFLAIGTIAILTVGVSYANFRFPRLRPYLDGEPIVVVHDGNPIERNLRRERLTLDD